MNRTASQRPLYSRFAAVGIAVLLSVANAACDKSTEPEIPPAPVVSGFSASSVAATDTIEIRGSGFAPVSPATSAIVTFANPVAAVRPFAGSDTRLKVVVPRDAITGRVSVTIPEQPEKGTGPALTVAPHDVGEVWLFQGVGAAAPLSLDYPSGSARYLLVPHGSDPAAPYSQQFTYSINTATPAPTSGRSGVSAVTGTRGSFHGHLRDEAVRLYQEYTVASASAKVGSEPERSPAAVRQFNVLNSVSARLDRASSYDRITAQLRYDKPGVSIYSDVDTMAANNFTAAQYKELGDLFVTMLPVLHSSFGSESDIDKNQKVILVFSPVVNRLTPKTASGGFYGGFFNSVDLFRAAGSGLEIGTTNEGEFLYLLAADTVGTNFDPDFLFEEDKTTMAHEFEHLISFSDRVFNRGGAIQATWLEEGMAHMAEDIVGRNDSNVRRANLYLAAPNAVSLEDNSSGLEQRGGMYLMLRWLGDHAGDDIYKRMVQSKFTGRSSIEAIAGEDFYRTFADFIAALYLSGRAINTDALYNFKSIDLLADFAPLEVTSWTVDGAARGGVVRRSAAAFHIVSGGAPSTDFVFSAASSARLRTTVVRIE